MPDRTQDLTNHRQVAVACKNYTDKEIKASEERILSIVARNNVDFIDHTDEPTYRFTAPANAKLLMLQSIAGNSNKIAPSTPSDDSVARLKTIPDNTYKSQVDYIGGKTVKYNQLITNPNFTSTSDWVALASTFSVNNNIGTFTRTSTDDVLGAIPIKVVNGHKYLLNAYTKVSFAGDVVVSNALPSTSITVVANTWTLFNAIITASFSNDNVLLRITIYNPNGDNVGDTLDLKQFELIDLTDIFGAGNEPSDVATAIPLLKANGYKLDGTDEYSTGELKHAIVSGVKYDGANVLAIINKEETTSYNITFKAQNGMISIRNTPSVNISLWFEIEPLTLENGVDYLFKLFYDATSSYISFALRKSKTDSSDGINLNTTGTAIVGNGMTYNYFLIYVTTSFSGSINWQPMIVRGSTAPSTYIPYVAPITKAIPSQVLADVRYGISNGNNYNKLDCNTKHLGGVANKLVIDGINNTNMSIATSETGYTRFTVDINNAEYVSASTIPNLTSIFTNISFNEMSSAPNSKSITLFSSTRISVYVSGMTTLTDYQNYFSNNPLEVIFNSAQAFDQDYSQYFTDGWNKVDLDKQYATCEMIVAEPIDMPNKVEYYGTIIHSLATAVKQDGFNVWDEEWVLNSDSKVESKNYINVSPNTQYYWKAPTLGTISYYDSNFNYIDKYEGYNDRVITTPLNCKYLKFAMSTSYGTTYKNDICINISNQDLNGTYKPYKAPITRLLPNSEAKYSWGITNGVRNVRTYCDDEGNAVNEGSLVVGNQDLGGLNYTYEDSTYHIFSTPIPSNMKAVQLNKLCANYTITSNTNWDRADKTLSLNGSLIKIIIKDMNFSNATIFKTANDGVPLFYEKNTTDTETLDDFDFSFDCEEGDTFTIIGCELLQCYATYSFLIKEAKSNE